MVEIGLLFSPLPLVQTKISITDWHGSLALISMSCMGKISGPVLALGQHLPTKRDLSVSTVPSLVMSRKYYHTYTLILWFKGAI